MQASTWNSFAATHLHLLGSEPGAGFTHKPSLSFKILQVALRHVRMRLARPGGQLCRYVVAFGTESWDDNSVLSSCSVLPAGC